MRFTGFRMLKSGWRKFRLDPQLWGTDGFTCAIPTPWGPLRMKADAFGVSVDVPDVFDRIGEVGMTFRLRAEYLPKKPEKPIEENQEESAEEKDAACDGEPG
jgi:hypothetical protein